MRAPIEPRHRATRPPSRRLPRAVLLAAVVALASGSVVSVAAPSPIVQEIRVVLTVEPLLVLPGAATRSLAKQTVEIPAGELGNLEIGLDLPPPDGSARLRVRASSQPGASEEIGVSLESMLTLGDRPGIRSERRLVLRDGTTGFFEAGETSRGRVLLAVRAETTTAPVAVRAVAAGNPVRLRLEVEREQAGRSISLETNVLQTFVGQGVEYAFRRGEGDSEESVRLLLTPIRVAGGIAEIAVDVEGRLPASPAPLLLSRRETLVTTRGATSTLTVVAGDPPAGYRFRVTPEF